MNIYKLSSIGKYKLIEKIAESQHSVVFKARSEDFVDDVAVKIILPQNDLDFNSRVESFFKEVRLASSTAHTHIMSIYETSFESPYYYYVMDYCEKSLSDLDTSEVSPEQFIAWISQLARALNSIHKQGHIHGSIKPSNILIQNNILYLSDLGSRYLYEATDFENNLKQTIYASPEQKKGESLDLKSDMYSLGVVLFELLSQHYPFKNKDLSSISTKKEDITQRPWWHHRLPCDIDSIRSRVLAPKKERRYSSCLDFSDALEFVLENWNNRVLLEFKKIQWASLPDHIKDNYQESVVEQEAQYDPIKGNNQLKLEDSGDGLFSDENRFLTITKESIPTPKSEIRAIKFAPWELYPLPNFSLPTGAPLLPPKDPSLLPLFVNQPLLKEPSLKKDSLNYNNYSDSKNNTKEESNEEVLKQYNETAHEDNDQTPAVAMLASSNWRKRIFQIALISSSVILVSFFAYEKLFNSEESILEKATNSYKDERLIQNEEIFAVQITPSTSNIEKELKNGEDKLNANNIKKNLPNNNEINKNQGQNLESVKKAPLPINNKTQARSDVIENLSPLYVKQYEPFNISIVTKFPVSSVNVVWKENSYPIIEKRQAMNHIANKTSYEISIAGIKKVSTINYFFEINTTSNTNLIIGKELPFTMQILAKTPQDIAEEKLTHYKFFPPVHF